MKIYGNLDSAWHELQLRYYMHRYVTSGTALDGGDTTNVSYILWTL